MRMNDYYLLNCSIHKVHLFVSGTLTQRLLFLTSFSHLKILLTYRHKEGEIS